MDSPSCSKSSPASRGDHKSPHAIYRRAALEVVLARLRFDIFRVSVNRCFSDKSRALFFKNSFEMK